MYCMVKSPHVHWERIILRQPKCWIGLVCCYCQYNTGNNNKAVVIASTGGTACTIFQIATSEQWSDPCYQWHFYYLSLFLSRPLKVGLCNRQQSGSPVVPPSGCGCHAGCHDATVAVTFIHVFPNGIHNKDKIKNAVNRCLAECAHQMWAWLYENFLSLRITRLKAALAALCLEQTRELCTLIWICVHVPLLYAAHTVTHPFT